MAIFLAVSMPLFQVADEYAHALRADQISRGRLVSPRLGGEVDGALYALGHLYTGMPFHYQTKQTIDVARASAMIGWAMPDHDENFQNTAQYGPALYLPQVLGIWIGKLLGLNPVWTILCARLVNGLVAVSVGFIAIRICRLGQAMLFTTLLLPMTMSEFASASQDALIISLSLLMVALASFITAEKRAARTWELVLFMSVVVLTALARPSQVALLALGPAFVRWREVRWLREFTIVALGLICFSAWMITLPGLMPEEPGGASVSGQLRAIIGHPLLLPTVLINTFRESGAWLFETLVGRLGWLDTPMPSWYFGSAAVALGCAWLAPGNRPPIVLPALLGIVTLFAVLMATSAALYMSWTPIGKMTIDGVQGRYMLPVLALIGWTAPAFSPRLARRLSIAWVGVAVFPMVSMAALPTTIMARYYGDWSTMGSALKTLFFT